MFLTISFAWKLLCQSLLFIKVASLRPMRLLRIVGGSQFSPQKGRSYTISISILSASQEWLSLVESNQQIYDFHIVDLCQKKFCISKLFIQCNTGSCCVHITGDINWYLCVSQSIGPSVCLSLWVWYQIRVLAKTMSFMPNLQ